MLTQLYMSLSEGREGGNLTPSLGFASSTGYLLCMACSGMQLWMYPFPCVLNLWLLALFHSYGTVTNFTFIGPIF